MVKVIKRFLLTTLQAIKEVFIRVLKTECHAPKFIATLGVKGAFGFYGVLFLIGRVILHYEPFKLGLIHQIVLSMISLLVIHMLKLFYDVGEKLLEESSGLRNTPSNEKDLSMYDIACSMKKRKNSIWCFILPIIPAVQFAYKTMYLEYVPQNFTGYYAAFFGAITFYVALIAYVHLVISMIYFRKVSNNHGNCLYIDYPQDLFTPPRWLALWVSYFRHAEKAFFISGMLFTFEYTVLMPKGIITLKPNIIIHSKDPIAFLDSWLKIVVLIIIAFPIIAFIIRKMFKTLLGNMRKIADKKLSLACAKSSVTEIWAYGQISSTSMKFGAYIFQNKSYIPLVTTAISFALNVAKLYESILIPLFSRI